MYVKWIISVFMCNCLQQVFVGVYLHNCIIVMLRKRRRGVPVDRRSGPVELKPCLLTVKKLKSLSTHAVNFFKPEPILDDTCAICLSDFSVSSGTTLPILVGAQKLKTFNNVILQLSCKHCFHSYCLLEWLKLKWECPCCKASVDLRYTCIATEYVFIDVSSSSENSGFSDKVITIE